MAKNYKDQLEDGINELIADLSGKTNWPYSGDEEQVAEIINSLRTNTPASPGPRRPSEVPPNIPSGPEHTAPPAGTTELPDKEIAVRIVEEITNNTAQFINDGTFKGNYSAGKTNQYHFFIEFGRKINSFGIIVAANANIVKGDIWKKITKENNRWLLGINNPSEKTIIFKFEEENKIIKTITVKINFEARRTGTTPSSEKPDKEPIPEEEKEGFFSKVKNWFKPKRKSAVEREEKTKTPKPAKIDAKIIIRKQGERTPKTQFVQGEIIQLDAVVTQDKKTIEDFKIRWVIKDKSTNSSIPIQNPNTGYFTGDPAQQLIYTDSLVYAPKKKKEIQILLEVLEDDEIKVQIREKCTVIPNPAVTPPKPTELPSPEEPDEKEPIPEEEKEGFFSKVKNWFKPKRKSAVETGEESKRKSAEKTPRMRINLADKEVKQTGETISLNIFNAKNEIVSAENSNIETLRPDINSNFTAITTPANLVEQRKLKYRWIAINEKNIIIDLKTAAEKINYAFLYGKITEGIWNLRCELTEPYFIFKNKPILSAVCGIRKLKTESEDKDEEKTEPEGIPPQNEEPPSQEKRKLNPQIIRIYHGKELPKKSVKKKK